MLDTTFTEFHCTNAATPPVVRNVRIGRSRLGVQGCRLLDELRRPMNSMLQSAWARAMRANPEATIKAYAEVRGVKTEEVEAAVDEFLTDRSGYAKA